MNRTEANAIADCVEELRLLEQLKAIIDDGDVCAIELDANTNDGGKRAKISHIGAAVAALSSSVTNRIVYLKTQLGITDDHSPVAVDETTPATAEKVGGIGGEPQPTPLDETPIATPETTPVTETAPEATPAPDAAAPIEAAA